MAIELSNYDRISQKHSDEFDLDGDYCYKQSSAIPLNCGKHLRRSSPMCHCPIDIVPPILVNVGNYVYSKGKKIKSKSQLREKITNHLHLITYLPPMRTNGL